MKVLYITTISNTVNAFLIPHIKMLIDQGHEVDVAFNIEQEVKREIIDMGCKIHEIPFKRSPLEKDNFLAYQMLKNIIMDEGYNLVHTHTPVASAIVRLVCKKMKAVKVIYTAHGFHFFKGAPLINWLIYYPIERWLARYTDILITINKEDHARAKNSFKAGRLEYIPGVGIDTKKINEVIIDKSEKRRELDIPEGSLVVLSVGELNKNKNHETVIMALAKLNNPNIHYLICGQGGLENYLRKLATELGIEKQVHLLGFRKDVAEICKISDLFVFPSLREGLGLAALEAMASGLPIITSNIHGIVDYSIDGKTGYTFDSKDTEGFAEAIVYLIKNEKLRARMGKYNSEAVKIYDWKNVEVLIEEIYRGL